MTVKTGAESCSITQLLPLSPRHNDWYSVWQFDMRITGAVLYTRKYYCLWAREIGVSRESKKIIYKSTCNSVFSWFKRNLDWPSSSRTSLQMTRYPWRIPLSAYNGGGNHDTTRSCELMETAWTPSGGWLGTTHYNPEIFSTIPKQIYTNQI